jgi:hypothetical protein
MLVSLSNLETIEHLHRRAKREGSVEKGLAFAKKVIVVRTEDLAFPKFEIETGKSYSEFNS